MRASPVVPLLRGLLRRACPAVHAVRAAAVVAAVEALVLGAKLALTHLGRNLRSAAFAKHSTKRVDRLLGNAHLHRERALIYRAIAHRLRGDRSPPRPGRCSWSTGPTAAPGTRAAGGSCCAQRCRSAGARCRSTRRCTRSRATTARARTAASSRACTRCCPRPAPRSS